MGSRRDRLGSVLRAAFEERLDPGAWLFLADESDPSPDTTVLILDDDEDADLAFAAAEQGFPYEGLDSGSLAQVASWTRQFEDPPCEDLLVESYLWYWKHDGFLPEPGAQAAAADPQAWQLEQDRAFYDGLGQERAEVPCRVEGCARGAIQFSVRCRPHHFEKSRGRPSPFED